MACSGQRIFFCQLSKDLQLEWTFECVLALTLSVQWDSQAQLLAGQVSLHTHTHTHIYTQATMIRIEVYYILLVWTFRICFLPAVFFWRLEKLKLKKTTQSFIFFSICCRNKLEPYLYSTGESKNQHAKSTCPFLNKHTNRPKFLTLQLILLLSNFSSVVEESRRFEKLLVSKVHDSLWWWKALFST
jgi:hypothetical protein